MKLICIRCATDYTPEFDDDLDLRLAPTTCLTCDQKQFQKDNAPVFLSQRQRLPTKWDDKAIKEKWKQSAAESRAKIMADYNKRNAK